MTASCSLDIILIFQCTGSKAYKLQMLLGAACKYHKIETGYQRESKEERKMEKNLRQPRETSKICSWLELCIQRGFNWKKQLFLSNTALCCHRHPSNKYKYMSQCSEKIQDRLMSHYLLQTSKSCEQTRRQAPEASLSNTAFSFSITTRISVQGSCFGGVKLPGLKYAHIFQIINNNFNHFLI